MPAPVIKPGKPDEEKAIKPGKPKGKKDDKKTK